MRNTHGFPPDPQTSLDAAKSYTLSPKGTIPHNYAPQIKQMPLSYLKGISEVRSGIEPL